MRRRHPSIGILIALLLSCSRSPDIVWQWQLKSRSYAQPVADGNRVYIVSQAGEVICGDIQSGKKYWQAGVAGEIVAEPVVVGDAVFAAASNGIVTAFNKNDGKMIWQKSVPNDGFIAPLSGQDDLLLAPSQNGVLYAFQPGDGALVWKQEGNKKFNAKAVLNGKHIYIGGWAHEFICLNLDGTLNWRFPVKNLIAEECVLNRNVVYFSDYVDSVYALDAVSGRLIWRQATQRPTRPYLIAHNLFFTADNSVLMIKPDNGQVLRRTQTAFRISRMDVFGENVFLTSQKGQIFRFDPSRGSVKQVLPSALAVYKAVLDGEIMIACDPQSRAYGIRLR